VPPAGVLSAANATAYVSAPTPTVSSNGRGFIPARLDRGERVTLAPSSRCPKTEPGKVWKRRAKRR
jgi:hypothetical protein